MERTLTQRFSEVPTIQAETKEEYDERTACRCEGDRSHPDWTHDFNCPVERYYRANRY